MQFKKTKLKNGLRVITAPVKGASTVMVLVAVETGSNYESKKENGLSHFLEHMCFKGTTKRTTASDIAKELDGLGAANNAFTSNEMTGYYARASKKHLPKLMDVVSDMYLNPTLPEEDLETERGVILEEISMYEDLPQKKVSHVLSKLLHGDTPSGRTILGPRENIKKFSRQDFVDYRSKHYVAGKTMVIVSGDVTEKEVLNLVNEHFSKIPREKILTKDKVLSSQKSPKLLVEYKKTDQAHMMLAFRAFGARDKRMGALYMLAEILGQGMSSRLFNRLREKMGACYYVRARVHEYTDHGELVIATGINSSRSEEVLKALLEECKNLVDEVVSDSELKKAKEHHIGHLYMDSETTDALALLALEHEVVSGKLKTPKEIEKEIRKITAKDIQKVAKEVFQNKNMNLAIIGDIKNKTKLKKALKF